MFPPSAYLFAFETPLAVAARRQVPAGLEMSYFSYFPNLATQQCLDYHLINDELVDKILKGNQLGGIVLTDFDLALLGHQNDNSGRQHPAPSAWLPELQNSYDLAGTVKDFGLFRDDLYVLLPRPGPGQPHPDLQ